MRVLVCVCAGALVNGPGGTTTFCVAMVIERLPCAIAQGASVMSPPMTTVPVRSFTTGSPQLQSNTRITATESGRHLVYISGAATLAQVVRALNTIGVSPRDLIAIIQALRESGSLQADVQII